VWLELLTECDARHAQQVPAGPLDAKFSGDNCWCDAVGVFGTSF
jgi:hypothetical protein